MATNSDFATKYGFGPYPVTEVEHFLIPVRDGVRLAAKAWFPSTELQPDWFPGSKRSVSYQCEGGGTGCSEERYPLILEYLPYRKSDFTAQRDHRRHPWLASQGYVMLRVDIRGTGESEGLYFDEYLQQEQDDCVDVMKWVSAQPWSTGKIGMMGKSWGGFNGLQLAYCQPPELQAVVTLYSTDDRYATDMHHDGGCVMDGLLSWASTMLVFNGRCPDPRLVPTWKTVWRERLNNTFPWSKFWLERQLRDDYWAHGSVCEDYAKVTCPVLLVGGWRDGYRDSVFRMVEKLPNSKAIIGPWPHEWPDTTKPGPNVEYLKILQQWFDQHLKGMETGVMKEPKLRLYLEEHRTPAPSDYRPGRWIQLDRWPSKQVHDRLYTGQGGNLLTGGNRDKAAHDSSWDEVPFSLVVGMNQGLWLQMGTCEAAPDQRLSDAYSLVYTSDVILEEKAFIGRPTLDCKVKVTNHNQGMLAARLVDVFPDGTSTLVTYGVLNLTHVEGHSSEKVRCIESGEVLSVSIQLHASSYVFPAGHKFKLCLSSSFWPICWPSSKNVDMHVSEVTLKMPVVASPREYTSDWFNVANPRVGPPMGTNKLEAIDESIKLEVDFPRKKYTRTVTTGVVMPRTHLEPLGVTLGTTVREVAEVTESDPSSAKLHIVHEYTQDYPEGGPNTESGSKGSQAGEGGMSTAVYTESSMEADDTHFLLYNKLRTTLNGEVFFEKEWKDKIERLFV